MNYRDEIIGKVVNKHPETDLLTTSPTLCAAECIDEALNQALDFLYIELLCPEQVAKLFDAKFGLGRWS